MAQFEYLVWLAEYFKTHTVFNFEWDEGNSTKSEIKHRVSQSKIEACFSDPNLYSLGKQKSPLIEEERFAIIGKDMDGKLIFVCFTFRASKIRPISCRFANIKEKVQYEKKE